MSRAIVHIGAGKTGSTAIQYALSHNQARLTALGFRYPRLKGGSTRRDATDHNRLAYHLLEPRRSRVERASATALAIAAREKTVTLLSGEIFYMRPFESEFPNADLYLQAKGAAIDRLMALLSPFDRVDVLCYVRRHDRWLESIYNQRLKTGRAGELSFDEFAASFGRAHYLPQLDAWAERLPNGRVTVRPYEAAMRGEGGLIGDFFKTVGIEVELPTPKETLRSVNPGLGRDYVEFMRRAQQLPLRRRARARLSSGLMSVSARRLAQTPEPKSWSLFLSREKRMALLQSFAEDDAAVTAKYLHPDFNRLFDAPEASENADYPGLSTDRAFEIAAELLEYDEALGSPIVRRARKLASKLRPRMNQK